MIQFHYRLGLLHEGRGETREAAEAYGKFLEYWKDADADLSVLTDARARLNALQAV